MGKETWESKSKVAKLDQEILKKMKWKFPKIWIDGSVEFLHYRCTFVALVIVSLLLTFHHLLTEPILCRSEEGEDSKKVEMANWYCLIHSTYTVPKSKPGLAVHPGVAPVRIAPNGGEVIRQRYYLWVHMLLGLIGICFYAPRFFWKSFEQGHLRMLTSKLTPKLNRDKKVRGFDPGDLKKVQHVLNYFLANQGHYTVYFCAFLLTQLLYVINVLAQIICVNAFLGGEMTTYGVNVFGYVEQNPEKRVDGIEAVFPKVAKCNMDRYGPSGNVEHRDFICLLPNNILNEKVFIWIWFWFLNLSMMTAMLFSSWILFIVCPSYRFQCILPLVTSGVQSRFAKHMTLSDLFVIYMLKMNLKRSIYFNFLVKLDQHFEKTETETKLVQIAVISKLFDSNSNFVKMKTKQNRNSKLHKNIRSRY